MSDKESVPANTGFTIQPLPKPYGHWVLPHDGVYKYKFPIYSKPTWIQKKAMKWLLGFGWEDTK